MWVESTNAEVAEGLAWEAGRYGGGARVSVVLVEQHYRAGDEGKREL